MANIRAKNDSKRELAGENIHKLKWFFRSMCVGVVHDLWFIVCVLNALSLS